MPGSYEDPLIQCNVIHHSLSDSLEYEALSYTWGDPNDREIIFLDPHGAALSVTRNCYNALRRLRKPGAWRTVWVDAICINQRDLEERAEQVKKMHHIFGQATQVTAYLGEADADSEKVLTVVAKIEESLDDPQFRASFDLHKAFPDIIEPARRFFRRAWFHRVWILQEVRRYHKYERLPILTCGSQSTDLDILYDFVTNYDQETSILDERVPILFRACLTWGDDDEPMFPRGPYVEENDSWDEVDRAQFWDALKETRTLEATNPRDKVFALFSLLRNPDAFSSWVDYTNSPENIFLDIALYVLPVVGPLILEATLHPHSRGSILPSWVPDWSNRTGFTFYPFEYSHRRPMRHSVSRSDESVELHELQELHEYSSLDGTFE